MKEESSEEEMQYKRNKKFPNVLKARHFLTSPAFSNYLFSVRFCLRVENSGGNTYCYKAIVP